MKVKVKIKDILYETEKATLFLISEKEVWLPNSLFILKDNFIIISEKTAKEKNLKYTTFLHIPKKMEVIKNQQPIKELEC